MNQLVSQKSKKINDSENNSSDVPPERSSKENISNFYQKRIKSCLERPYQEFEAWINLDTGQVDKDYTLYRNLFDDILKDASLGFQMKSLYLRNLETYFNVNCVENAGQVR